MNSRRALGHPLRPASGLSRREVLVLGAAGLALAGCTGRADADGEATGTPEPAPVHTIESMLAAAPFLVAHRGSWDNWPEHTMTAYRESANAGAVALEISVSATSDGTLICHHDLSTERTTGRKLVIKDSTYAEVSELMVDARAWLGPEAVPEKIPLLKDVLDAFAATHVLFIDDKQGTNANVLLDLMDTYPESHSHFIWKQSAEAAQIDAVSKRGYSSWGYFTVEQLDLVPALADKFTYLGVHHSASDAALAEVVSTGKPVISWEVHTRELRDRLLGLGVSGLMCANLPYLSTDEPMATSDSFGDGIRAAGDLPWMVSQGWDFQPELKTSGTLLMSAAANSSYRMGSLGPLRRQIYSIQFDMRWPEALPADDTLHAGIAFGQDDDRPYRVLIPSDVGGYHLVVRLTGEMTLLLRSPGESGGLRLGTVDTQPVRVGEWMSFKIDIDPDSIRYSRLDGAGWAGSTSNRKYRGGYFSLARNYSEDCPVEFRGVKVI
ncbi:glycerophosphodiester phosphodiesterase [Arthrobacter zhaoxinii]|uniref:glycerophosphodiester phosphodiesterase n=1 Tax=Arthrobacter zhaoxinii TaxID=2964616 RepID=UPI0021070291|nr:glycerophosphodiester phosphodiesterase [Arthrobacter zhaoxinii]MCQ2001746.1 glycerophosphodiester phosphodiesterase [Arthrobacter zhaoxinii]